MAWIRSVMDLTNYRLDLIEHRKGINMSYNFILDRIGVDISRIQEAKDELTFPVRLKTYIEVMTLHELGHAADREALMESMPWTIKVHELKKAAPEDSHYRDPGILKFILDEQLMNIEFEKTAWKNAESLNRLHQIADEAVFGLIREHSLASYEMPYQQNLRLYDRLLTEANDMIA
ncbi:integrase [Planomicrobium okeanokoites]|uniref:integrase n=1 Tax=Planomicrobium okeanokoites TaxID=244 RepID=UPI00249376ED|nr:integrase [Planomicrobium okeanokoites]